MERLLIASLAVLVSMVLITWIALALGADRRASVYAVFVAGLFFVTGGAVARQRGWFLTLALLVIAVGVVFWITKHLKSSVLADAMVIVFAVGLISGPLIDAVGSALSFGESQMTASAVAPVDLDLARDVYLVVVDGFPGLETLSMDFGPDAGRALSRALVSQGFQVPREVWSSYPSTNYSVPSILEMNYVVEEPAENAATTQDLYDVISGDNPVRASFSKSGYTTWMVESGWSGSSCRSWYDECVVSSWLDAPMYEVFRDSMISRFVTPQTGQWYGVGATRSMNWLSDNLPTLSDNGERDFVFGHVVAPHPPFFLRSDCSVSYEEARSGYFFWRAGIAAADRDAFLRAQVQCIESFMFDLASRVDEGQILVFMSDHGTERRDQLFTDPERWSLEAREERMNAVVAARLPSTCDIGDDVFIVNFFRRLLSCFSSPGIPDLPDRMVLLAREWPDRLSTGG